MSKKSEPAPSGPPLKHGRCPRCGKAFTYTTIANHKPFPFCSARCREVDLGNWLAGRYSIPGEPLPPEPPAEHDHEGT
ncbi:MAG: DNA gyrase inhibitor YacG [Planctomycetota bacterium]|nr:DNA gyrase inhibitor YacG [Planctomycetota bacterium]